MTGVFNGALFTRAYLVVASGVFVLASAVHIASYGPVEWATTLNALAFIAFPLIFPVFFVTVGVTSLGRLPLDSSFGTLPLWVKVMGGCVVIYVFADFYLMIKYLPGNPTQQGSHYALNNHGDFTSISARVYLQELMYQSRLFTGHAIVLSGVSALAALQLDRFRRGVIDLFPGPPAELPRKELPGVFERHINMVAVVPMTPVECAALLTARMAEGSRWTFGRFRTGVPWSFDFFQHFDTSLTLP